MQDRWANKQRVSKTSRPASAAHSAVHISSLLGVLATTGSGAGARLILSPLWRDSESLGGATRNFLNAAHAALLPPDGEFTFEFVVCQSE